MIPRIIHYCWFGKNPYPEEFKVYLNEWEKICPDYQIIEWNESNFDVSCNSYVEEAYRAKKWAFVTDYVRLWAIYTYGGIYMDTDVQVLKSLDRFLDNEAFSGFESSVYVPTGIMGAEKGNTIIKELLDEYDNRHFLLENGKMNLQTNVEYITEFFVSRGLVLNNHEQTVDGFTFYPSDFFCPKNSRTLKLELTENTHTIHHFAGSWAGNKTKLRKTIKTLVGPQMMGFIIRIMDKMGIK